jgi:hypothetical protein
VTTVSSVKKIADSMRHNRTMHQLFIDIKKAYDSVRKEVVYNILIKFGVPTKLVRLIKLYLNETFREVRAGKHLSHKFPVENTIHKEMLYRYYFSTLL